MNYAESIRLSRRILGGQRKGLLRFTHIIALGSIALSSAALLITFSVLEGFERELTNKSSLFVAHVDARFLQPVDSIVLQRWITYIRTSHSSIRHITAYSETEVLITHRENVEAALLHIDMPVVPARLSAFGIPKGWDRESASVIIGLPLAERLGVRPGDSVVVFVGQQNTPHSLQTKVLRMKIEALFESGMHQFDESIILAPPLFLRQLGDTQQALTGLSIWVDPPSESRHIAQYIDSLFGRWLFVRTYTDRNPAMFAWITLQKRPIPIVVGILSIVAAFNILTLLFVTLAERRAAIATLRLLGMQRAHVMRMITLYGAVVGSIGFVLGMILSLLFGLIQQKTGIIRLDAQVYFIDRLPVEFAWWHGAAVGSVVLTLTLAVTTIPAYAATRISPLSLLRIK
ncbi:MAG: FtsX-like permease family protein [Bacteroidota bacterium]|nr:FtsX-like permease family protein [Candidatus Kapabacteria bacterium]MCS7302304.1 FtsX-like permease family protein [Candidatus Kapabacteria bacterium]MCX7936313.1 FtsX-like permease family protein [Chlorobiota bacterium]MDW8074405.1 FtsX-like permease family protein [Bacteroidota bacterium]MDW8271119.1 FtsX-like permease family protein [Bacteroidota bacterium]